MSTLHGIIISWQARGLLWAVLALAGMVAADGLPSAHAMPSPAPRLQETTGCVELLVNGDFAMAGEGWAAAPVTESGASVYLPVYASDIFRSRGQAMLLGDFELPNTPNVSAIEQTLTLPAAREHISFTFYYYPRYEGEVNAQDRGVIAVYDQASNQPLLNVVARPDNARAWIPGRYDLSEFAGRTVRLVFAVYNDGEPGRMSMYIDDVSVLACPFAADAAVAPQPETDDADISQPAPASVPPSMPTPEAPAADIATLAQCDCSGHLYTCRDFRTWSAAQACYNQCKISVGFDIHELDENRNGIACELDFPAMTAANPAPPIGLDDQPPPLQSLEPGDQLLPLVPEGGEEIDGDPPEIAPPDQADEVADDADDTDAIGAESPVTGTEAITAPATEPITEPVTQTAPVQTVNDPPVPALAETAPASADERESLLSLSTLLPLALVAVVVLLVVLLVGGLIGLWISRAMNANRQRPVE